ncbi:MAG: ribosomal protein S18-alanine N-acetyltransferase [SAR86 cluster bacterium]|nr:ribosomal protein S18-alanine N-acetyltransferase [SAR86 cluster bacterium]
MLKATETKIENFSEHHLKDVHAIESYSNPTPWCIQTFKKILAQRSLSFVIQSEEKLKGFCIASIVLDNCHLQNICVAHQYKRQGLGKRMLDTLVIRCQVTNIRKIILEVRQSNVKAQKFYKDFGFSKIGCRKDYYQLDEEKEDALIMRLPLQTQFL